MAQFPKGLVPAYDVVTTPYATQASFAQPDGLSDLVKHVKMHHVKMGHRKPSSAEVLAMIDKHSEGMGLSPEVGRGLLGQLWNGVKSGLQRAGSKLWDQVTSDPVGTFETIANLFSKAPVPA